MDPDAEYEIYFLTDRTIDYLLDKHIISQELLTKMIVNKGQFYGAFVLKNGSHMPEKHRFGNNVPIKVAKSIEIGEILGDIMGGSSPVSSNMLFLPASRMGLMLIKIQLH